MSTLLIGDCTGMMGGLTTLWTVSLFVIVPCACAGWCSWWVLAWPFAVIFGLAALWWTVFVFLARFIGSLFGAIFG